MKHSPLCSRDDGREIYFIATDGARKFRVTVSREVLDDECGDAATETERKNWVKANMADILEKRIPGGFVKEPIARVHVEEIT